MTILSLWQPILATAILTFIAGSVIWMFMPWHKKDWQAFPDEERVREAMKGLPAGQYNVPYCTDMKEMQQPGMQKKMAEGPIAFVNVLPAGPMTMGKQLVQMFLFNLLVAVVTAYVVSRTVTAGADYLAVFRIAGTVTFIAYGMAYIQESIWFGRRWGATVNTFVDALIYALLTGGVFGWLS